MNQIHHTVTVHAVAAPPIPAGIRIAHISASWHADIVGRSRAAFLEALEHDGGASAHVDLFNVPGAFEIPLLASRLAKTGQYDAIVACALVVDGGIYRHEFVASAVIDGLMRVQLDSGVPVLSAVLTPKDFHEHEDHYEFFANHFVKKGAEVAKACVAAVAGMRAIAD